MALCKLPRVLALLAGLTLAGCAFEPQGETPTDPPPAYREWWARTEACSGLTGTFDRIKWYTVPGSSFPCSGGSCVGHWESDHHIVISADWSNSEMVVRHEMLHDLVGHPGHPDPPFGKGCGLTWATWTGGSSVSGAAASSAGGMPRVPID